MGDHFSRCKFIRRTSLQGGTPVEEQGSDKDNAEPDAEPTPAIPADGQMDIEENESGGTILTSAPLIGIQGEE